MFVVLRNSAPYYSIYDNENELKDDLVIFLDVYQERYGYSHINYRGFDIEELVSFATEVSQEVINHGLEFGIVQIIKGTPLAESDDNMSTVTNATSNTHHTHEAHEAEDIWDLPEIQMTNLNSAVGTPYETPYRTPLNTPLAERSPIIPEPLVILESREMDEEN